MIPLMMRKANAQRISNRFALSFNPSCFCAELAAAVVLPVQAVPGGQLGAALEAVFLFEIGKEIRNAVGFRQFFADGIEYLGIFMGADGKGGGEVIKACLLYTSDGCRRS